MVENVDACETQVRYRRRMKKVARNVITEGSIDSDKANLSQHHSAFENMMGNNYRPTHRYLNTEQD